MYKVPIFEPPCTYVHIYFARKKWNVW